MRSLNNDQFDLLIASLRRDAFAIVEDAVPQNILNQLLAITASPAANANCNDLNTVILGETQFFTNVIAYSKTVHDLILSPFVLNLCTAYLGDNCQLVNNRIQTTRVTGAMPWHTDNNLLSQGKLIGRHNMPGLQFVLYLTNVSAAPFQLIKDSHKWSLNYKNQYLLDSDIKASNYEVIELNPSPGSLLILNTHAFHRAAPIRNSNYMRSILLFQADAISPGYPEHGEKLYVNPEFFSEANPQIFSFLGFGRSRAFPAFPETNIKTLNLKQFAFLSLSILNAFPRLLLKKSIKRIISADSLAKFKIFSVFLNSRKASQKNS